MKLNCWEILKCGYGPDGELAKEFGVCPVVSITSLDGVHGGMNAGRSCWMIKGTHCFNETQGSAISKIEICKECEAYRKIKIEESQNFKDFSDLIKRLDADDIL